MPVSTSDTLQKRAIAVRALSHRHCLHLWYDGGNRTVEIHTIGTLANGNEAMNVFQVSGFSASGAPRGWKMMPFDKCKQLTEASELSEAPRPHYKKNAEQFKTILAEV